MKITNNRKLRLSYYFFDWANSPFSTIIITFIISSYFVNKIAPDKISGTSLWGWTIAASGFLVATLGPILGHIADNKKSFSSNVLIIFTILIAFLCSMLWFVIPNQKFILFTLLIILLANTFFEISQIFYNSFLPKFKNNIPLGEFSGTAWAYGYLGGIFCLCIILFLLVLPAENIFNLDKTSFEHIRVTGPLVAIWYLLFSIPFLKYCTQFKKNINKSLKGKNFILDIFSTLKNKEKLKYLIARMIYTDGLITLFSFGGIYASGTFGFSFDEIIIFGIAINISAAIGSYLFGLLENKIGIKNIIMISLISLIMICIIILLIENKTLFWFFGFFIGFFIGSVQSSSRTALVHISGKKEMNKMFGLYAFSGKSTNFLGPLMVATLTSIFDSQRIGMSAILFFLILGFILIYTTKID